MKCNICGSEVKDGSKFCENCGAKLEVVNDIEETVNEEAKTEAPAAEEVKAEERVYAERVEGQIVSEPPKMENAYAGSGSTTSQSTSAGNTTYTDSASTSQNVQGTVQPAPSKGFAIASLICGILSLVCCCCSPIAVILGGVAVGLGIYVINAGLPGKEMAIAGIVCGGIGLAIFLFSMIGSATGAFSGIKNSIDLFDLDEIIESL